MEVWKDVKGYEGKTDNNKNAIEVFNGYPEYNKSLIYRSFIYDLPDVNGFYWNVEKYIGKRHINK